MVWYGMVWYGMVWHGIVWYGMAWRGLVFNGMTWCGMESPQEPQCSRERETACPATHTGGSARVLPPSAQALPGMGGGEWGWGWSGMGRHGVGY